MESRSFVAIVCLGAVAIAAIVVLRIFVPEDTTLIGNIIVILGLVATLLRSFANAAKIQSVHVDVNDRLSQLITAEKGVSRAEGAVEERERVK